LNQSSLGLSLGNTYSNGNGGFDYWLIVGYTYSSTYRTFIIMVCFALLSSMVLPRRVN